MKKSLMDSWIVVLCLCFISISGWVLAQDFTNYPASMLITSAKVADVGTGQVLHYFDQVSISQDPLRKVKGYFIFDASLQRFEATQVPLNIRYERAVKELKDGKWITVKPEVMEYNVDNVKFMEMLRSQLEKSKAIPDGFNLTTPLSNLNSFEKNKPLRWYLLPGDWKAVATTPQVDGNKNADAQVTLSRQNVDTSYLIELGDRDETKAKFEALNSQNAEAGWKLYKDHFETVPVSMLVYQLRPGIAPSNPRSLGGLSLVRHRDPAIISGQMVATGQWTMPVLSIASSKEGMTVKWDAGKLLSLLVTPAISSDGKKVSALACVFPEETDPEQASPTDCRREDVGGKQTAVVSGEIAKNAKSVKFIVEEVSPDGADNSVYHNMYRVEFQYDAEMALP